MYRINLLFSSPAVYSLPMLFQFFSVNWTFSSWFDSWICIVHFFSLFKTDAAEGGEAKVFYDVSFSFSLFPFFIPSTLSFLLFSSPSLQPPRPSPDHYILNIYPLSDPRLRSVARTRSTRSADSPRERGARCRYL